MSQMPLATVIEPVLDFTSKESYLVHSNKADAGFQNQIPINSYSGSLISVKLNLSNALAQVLDRIITMDCQVQYQVSGSRLNASANTPLLCDNEFGVKSNAFQKACSITTILMGSASSYSFDTQNGIIVSALEASCPMMPYNRQLQSIDNTMIDNVMNFDDVLYTNRSVLGLYSSNTGCELGRASYDIEILTNTPTSATFNVNYRFYVAVAPLISTIHVNSNEIGFTHIDSLNLNFQLGNLATRTLSFARNTNNGILKIDNINALFGPNFPVRQPTVQFTTYNIMKEFVLPSEVMYPLASLDRYSTLVSIPRGTSAIVSTPVVSLNSVPSYVLLFACYPTNLYNSQNITVPNDPNPVHATQLTDSFCPISAVQSQVNGVQLLSNSTSETLYRQYLQNGGNKTYQEFRGTKLIKTLLDPSGQPKYLYPASAPVKLNFSNDLIVRSPSGGVLSPGCNYKFNISFPSVTVTNTTPYSDTLELFMVFVYPQIVVLSGINNSQILVAPLSVEQCLAVENEKPSAHYSQVNSHDWYGWGGAMHKLMSHSKIAHKIRKHRLHSKHMKHAMQSVLGMGVSGGMHHRGMGMKKHSKKHSRKSALKFQ